MSSCPPHWEMTYCSQAGANLTPWKVPAKKVSPESLHVPRHLDSMHPSVCTTNAHTCDTRTVNTTRSEPKSPTNMFISRTAPLTSPSPVVDNRNTTAFAPKRFSVPKAPWATHMCASALSHDAWAFLHRNTGVPMVVRLLLRDAPSGRHPYPQRPFGGIVARPSMPPASINHREVVPPGHRARREVPPHSFVNMSLHKRVHEHSLAAPLAPYPIPMPYFSTHPLGEVRSGP